MSGDTRWQEIQEGRNKRKREEFGEYEDERGGYERYESTRYERRYESTYKGRRFEKGRYER